MINKDKMNKKKFYMEFGERLRRSRLFMNYSQEEMAEMLEVSERQYRRYELGNSVPQQPVLIKMRKIGLDLDYLGRGRKSVDIMVENVLRYAPDDVFDKVLSAFPKSTEDNYHKLEEELDEWVGLVAKVEKEIDKNKVIRDDLTFELFTRFYEENMAEKENSAKPES